MIRAPGRRRAAARHRTHPLIAAVRRALRGDRAALTRDYLTLLDDRLAGLAALAAGGPLDSGDLRLGPADRALARRFLSAHRYDWDDGDENLVRGFLDRWTREGEDPLTAAARGLIEAAATLASMRARPETMWFFLWEFESVLAALADNPGRAC